LRASATAYFFVEPPHNFGVPQKKVLIFSEDDPQTPSFCEFGGHCDSQAALRLLDAALRTCSIRSRPRHLAMSWTGGPAHSHSQHSVATRILQEQGWKNIFSHRKNNFTPQKFLLRCELTQRSFTNVVDMLGITR
jgi:hypothetical protein